MYHKTWGKFRHLPVTNGYLRIPGSSVLEFWPLWMVNTPQSHTSILCFVAALTFQEPEWWRSYVWSFLNLLRKPEEGLTCESRFDYCDLYWLNMCQSVETVSWSHYAADLGAVVIPFWFCLVSKSVLYSIAVTSHMWLLSIWTLLFL